MYENRDDTLPRAADVLGHFQRNVKVAALNKMRDAFKKAWSNNVQYPSPLDFEVSVEFGRVLPDDAILAVKEELKQHGWENYVIGRASKDSVDQHVMVVKLNHAEASKYA